jgi:hypothetical protein
MNRKMFRYVVNLLRSDGSTGEVEVRTRWSPKYEGINEAVGTTAAAKAWWDSGKKIGFEPVAVTFAGEVGAAA